MEVQKKQNPTIKPLIEITEKEAHYAIFTQAQTIQATKLSWDLKTCYVKAREQLARAGTVPLNVYAHAVREKIRLKDLKPDINLTSPSMQRPNRTQNRVKVNRP